MENKEKDIAGIDEAITTLSHVAGNKAEGSTSIEIHDKEVGKKDDSQSTVAVRTVQDSENNKDEGNDGIDGETSDSDEGKEQWKWWKRLNLIFEEIPQLLILIFFYQKVILVRDCGSLKEKINFATTTQILDCFKQE
eukprot:14941264-Ditylum_brightwellii.AAC.1